MKKVLSYMKAYKKESVLAPLFKLLEATFELFVPLVMAKIIDVGIAQGDKSYILKMGGVLVLLAAIGLTVSITAQFFAAKAAVGSCTALRQAMFDHIMDLDHSAVDKAGTSTLITRMTSDIAQVQNTVNMVLRLFLRSPVIVFGAMIMAFTIDVRSALIFTVAIPALAIVVYGVTAWSMPVYKRAQERLDKVLSLTRENLSGARVIRAFAREDLEREAFGRENDTLAGTQTSAARISAITNPVTYVIVNAAIMYLIYTGAVKVNIGELSQGQVVALLNYMSQILVELLKLANLFVLFSKGVACAKRIEAVLETDTHPDIDKTAASANAEADVSVTAPGDDAFIRFEGVGLTYMGAGDSAIRGVSFAAKKGETVGIIGGTGSGKTSLVSLAAGFYRATEGAVFIDGKNIDSYTDEELRKRISIVPQKAVLFTGSIRDNLKWGNPDADDERLWSALKIAQADEIVKGKVGGLDEQVEQGGRNFSGGQRQRLTIARAVAADPEILILDDSASALDYITEKNLRDALAGMKDTTKFIVSQRASSLIYADRIIVLDDGEVVGVGTNEELLKTCDVYREIYETQFERSSGEEAV
ncbi:MAG: ABC transporter ATP-binding protein/permease [Lachnospiraceae bacterium]|nr:ABC transporter ATP-binding protein/permease [Lachnospiraceae bacterium]